MFTIVISEKGGAERRETFEKNEINVGRVQGNDLMLPKGNVSKHHARLLYRDGRFIVTDLKSTNGTYVNGRKISQATIVREGDKIYVGDFVLKLETAQKAAGAQSPEPNYPAGEDDGLPSPGTPSMRAAANVAEESGASPAPAPPPAARPGPPPLPAAAAAPSPGPESEAAAHYPLERDPDELESAPELPPAPPPPPPPRAAVPPRPPPPHDTRTRTGSTMAIADRAPGIRRGSAAASPPARTPRSVPPPAPANSRPAPRETPEQAARRLALVTLIDRVADIVDLTPLEHSPVVADALLQPIERAVREQASAMRKEGEAPEGIDLEMLARDALRELVALGPLAPLLDDEETSEIHVVRPDCVLAVKNGQAVLADPSFTSEVALARIVARLAHLAGQPLRPGEMVVDRRLPRGAHMTAIAPPTANGWVLHIRKRRRIESQLPDMVRAGSMSDAVATYLEACAQARANVLVVGHSARAISSLLAAIAAAAPAAEKVAVLQHGADEIGIPQAHVIPLVLADHGRSGEEAVYAAARLGVDRLIVASLGGAVATATLDVIAEGSEGVLAGIGAPSLRHGLARLASQVALAHAGASVQAACAAVGGSFDVAVEVERHGGRARVKRVVELDGGDDKQVVTRDVFVLNTDANTDTAYLTTGASQFLARTGSQ